MSEGTYSVLLVGSQTTPISFYSSPIVYMVTSMISDPWSVVSLKITNLLNKMKDFLSNPYTYILSKFGYKVVKNSPIYDYLTRFTNSSYFEDRRHNNDLERYVYKLYSL